MDWVERFENIVRRAKVSARYLLLTGHVVSWRSSLSFSPHCWSLTAPVQLGMNLVAEGAASIAVTLGFKLLLLWSEDMHAWEWCPTRGVNQCHRLCMLAHAQPEGKRFV